MVGAWGEGYGSSEGIALHGAGEGHRIKARECALETERNTSDIKGSDG